jgi:hypothetical protein
MRMTWRYTASAVAALLLAGCGGTGNPFDSVPVSGKVTYEDGSVIPVQGMKVYFHCLEPPKDGMPNIFPSHHSPLPCVALTSVQH